MSRLTLEQFKTENKSTNDSRLTLDQFKNQTSENLENQELEKLAGGVLGACHSVWDDIAEWWRIHMDAYDQMPYQPHGGAF